MIYLHNNEIFEINNLDYTVNLTSLYLQKNRILKIENLRNLRKLKRLYLGHNTISVVEGLENLESLEELYLEKQFLYEGNCLCFDPRKNTLQVLNISHNKIQTISSLAPLKILRVLNASHNDLSDMVEVCSIIKDWFYLKELCFAQNPICKNRLYKEDLIANVYRLEILDQKDISEHTRNFLKRLHGERISQKLQRNVNFADKITGESKNYFLNLIVWFNSLIDLPKNYPVAVQKAVSISILKQNKSDDLTGDNLEIFDEKNAVFIPWKSRKFFIVLKKITHK
ncbi:LRR 4 domain containing protein [Asbolus verrucosus]|uniref:LRR 4 domain containing protein n=1 Tax=Asbolus verrucosus TaxID=1661398 RepID=A0A482VAB1_ASBVE|nr:LRR 4 domain containing protein [Asbolus verrucosus]